MDNRKDYNAKKSIINNFKTTPESKYGAAKWKYVLKRLNCLGFGAEQNILVSMVRYAFENNPSYSEVREQILNEIKQINL